jgi:arginase family enzyme
LRFSAPGRLIERFYREVKDELPPFVLYGSGDFHHLSALWIRQREDATVIVSFDNHPDWDIRPPKWCCGSWINRALELPHVHSIHVWGCGNFECWWPGQLFGNRRAERGGALAVHPWADDRPAKDQGRRGAIRRENWRAGFEQFVRQIAGQNVYVTIDMDCFNAAEAVTNWEGGRFTVADVVWALQLLRSSCRVSAGDLCGAYSAPKYARAKQRFASEIDHPKLARPERNQIRTINLAAFESLWPALTGS